MPSIDLAELRSQAYELAGLLADPSVFRGKLHALMESYAHRLLRRGPSMVHRSALPAWDVPGLLLRELEAALFPAAQSNAEAALAAADVIWKDGRLEERLLAAQLAGASGKAEEVRIRLGQWLPDQKDPLLLRELAEKTCLPLRNANPILFRAAVRQWVEDRTPALRCFGWMALQAWLEEGGAEPLLAAFDLLSVALRETDPEVIHLAAEILAALAKRAPAETVNWLEDLPPESILRGRTLLRSTVPMLPPEMADSLRKRMRRP